MCSACLWMQSSVLHCLRNLLAFGPEEQGFDELLVMLDCSSAYETLRQALAQQIRFVFSKLEVISEVFLYIYRNEDSSQVCTAR